MSGLPVLRAELHAYRDFEECVVVGVQWLNWGASLSIDIDFVWQEDGTIRTQYADRRIVSIRFCGVSELHVINELSDSVMQKEASLGWGFGEIACLRVEDAGALVRSRLTGPSYKASFRREGYSWIEITFKAWEFSESTQVASQSPLNSE